MNKFLEFFNGIDLKGKSIVNFKPHEVAVLPVAPFLGQTVFLTANDGAHVANKSYQWDGTAWETLTHTELTVAAGSTDYLDITNNQISLKQLAVGKVIVDEVSLTLEAWITASGYDGSQAQEGDILLLPSATTGQKTYIHKNGSAGDATDFIPMFDELTAAEVRGYFADGTGTAYDPTDGSFDVLHDNSTVGINGFNQVEVKDSGITENKLAPAVTTKLNDGFPASIGNGADSVFTINHGKGTRNLIIGVADTLADYKDVYPTVTKPTDTTIVVDFGEAVPANGQYLVTIKAAM